MKNRHRIFISIMLAVITVFSYSWGVFAYYYDYAAKSAPTTSGSVKVAVENLTLNNIPIEELPAEAGEQISNGNIIINSSDLFSFSLVNSGKSNIDFSLTIALSWQDEIDARGKLFVYPDGLSDEEIYEDIDSGDFEFAVVNSLFDGSQGEIAATVSGGTIAAIETIDFAYRLFLYKDGEIAELPHLFHHKNIEVGIFFTADVAGRSTGWEKTAYQAFIVTSYVDTRSPIIIENYMAKTFFIGQASGINLADYASAYDETDGDLTSYMTVSCSPSFDAFKEGVYTVTYRVKNSLGNYAAPLSVVIIIWNFIKIESGSYHTLALTSHGKVYAWGDNYYGQLGNGTNSGSSTAKLIPDLDNITDIAAGDASSVVLSADGQIYTFGSNNGGKLGIGSETASVNVPMLVESNESFVQISAAYDVVGALTDKGEVYAWGYAAFGAVGNGSSSNKNTPQKVAVSSVVKLAIGQYNGAALTENGDVYIWGYNGYGLMCNGSDDGRILRPTLITYFADRQIRLTDISLSWHHAAAVDENGQLYTWGYGLEGRLGNNSEVDSYYPLQIPLSFPVKQVDVQYGHTAVVAANGTAYLFGQNTYGKLGNNTTENQLSPIVVSGINNAVFAALAVESSFILTSSGEVYGMGYGGVGVLGNGANVSSQTPVKWAFTPPPPS